MRHLIKDKDAVESILEALGTPTRLRILNLIADEPRYLSEISRILNIGQQAVIRHMKKLQEMGLVTLYTQKARQARIPRHYYRLNPDFNCTITLNSMGFRIEYENRQIRLPPPKQKLTITHPLFLRSRFIRIKELDDPQEKINQLYVLEKQIKELNRSINLIETFTTNLQSQVREYKALLEKER
ncbi:MAG: ArsR/SmtB family transcription factor [Candidatus Ranarchaeia archaeon]